MALTRDFKEAIAIPFERDPAFAKELLDEATFLNTGEAEMIYTKKSIARGFTTSLRNACPCHPSHTVQIPTKDEVGGACPLWNILRWRRKLVADLIPGLGAKLPR
jgi:hypothetical protein